MASIERPGSVHEDVEMFTIDFLFFLWVRLFNPLFESKNGIPIKKKKKKKKKNVD
jgi:hypothetical protein